MKLEALNHTPKLIARIIEACSLLGPGEILPTGDLAARVKSSLDRVYRVSKRQELSPYRVLHKQVLYWGNRVTITDAKRKLA